MPWRSRPPSSGWTWHRASRSAASWRGLDRVAAYVPGGTAAYPSSLLMSAIPARLAGVGSYVVASPASADGRLSPALLGAAGLMEVDEFWVMGGAQAVGALAYGTESIGRVDKIVGPGNAWVTAAKLEVLDRCAIDMPAGPTEVMVVADDTADPVHVAADLLSQAEHGADSPALLVTTSAALAAAVEDELARQLPTLLRRETLAASLAGRGHHRPDRRRGGGSGLRRRVRARAPLLRGSGLPTPRSPPAARRLPVPGPLRARVGGRLRCRVNHVLPTAGAGRAYSPLGVESFGRWMQVNRITREGLASITPAVAAVAEAEGLNGTPPRGRDPLRGRALMSLPVTEAIVAASNVYTWEPSNQSSPSATGWPATEVLRFDPNTSPAPPAFVAQALAGPLDPRLNEYPDCLYADLARRPPTTWARTAPRILVGAAPTRSLDIIAKTFIPAAWQRVDRAHTHVRHVRRAGLAARRDQRCRATPGTRRRLRHRPASILERLPETRSGLAVRAQQPHRGPGVGEPPSRPSWTLAPGCPGRPGVVVDEAYVEFRAWLGRRLRERYRASSSCARSPRPSPCRACAWATPWLARPTIAAAWSACVRRAASPRSQPPSARAALRRPELASRQCCGAGSGA